MNYKDYVDLLNQKFEVEMKSLDLLYTKKSKQKEYKIKDLKKEFNLLKTEKVEDLHVNQSIYLFKKYFKVRKESKFQSFDTIDLDDNNIGNYFFIDIQNMLLDNIKMLPFFVYNYIEEDRKSGILVITKNNLNKLIVDVQSIIKQKEEQKIISYEDYMDLLNNKFNAESKLVDYNFRYTFYQEELEREYSKLKCKSIKELTDKEKLSYIDILKRGIEREDFCISHLVNFTFHISHVSILCIEIL